MDQDDRELILACAERAQELAGKLRWVACGDKRALADLRAQCRFLPGEGSVWCLSLSEVIDAALHPGDDGADPVPAGDQPGESCDIGAGPQRAGGNVSEK